MITCDDCLSDNLLLVSCGACGRGCLGVVCHKCSVSLGLCECCGLAVVQETELEED